MGLIFASGLSMRLRLAFRIVRRPSVSALRCRRPATGIGCGGRPARAGKQGKPRGSKLDAYEASILAMVDENKDIALYEIADRLCEEHDIHAAPSTVWHFFAKRGITFKKRRRMRASNSVRT